MSGRSNPTEPSEVAQADMIECSTFASLDDETREEVAQQLAALPHVRSVTAGERGRATTFEVYFQERHGTVEKILTVRKIEGIIRSTAARR